MTIKCLVVCSNELIGLAVEKLCKTQADMDVHKVQFGVEADLIQELKGFQPDVLISDESADANYPIRLQQSPVVNPNMRVILLNDQANILYVYQKQVIAVTQVSDLLAVVRDQPVRH